ncbi:toll/interleukin-1 receptor domain-containing protein [Actinosynnema sp. NPDC050801]|uniref:toll/interleukin-1 receptor domain-containing protein n=1 Tax=unclassified Actinosynnema TaxID=2637065 RepID=UPI0034033DA2
MAGHPEYDLFISYSHRQREFVQALAVKLRRSQLRVWFDDWEMQPGDYLRDRIVSGIGQSRYLLVLMSTDALTSNWVKYELNCGITSEIEALGVVVIPALAPEMSPELLPLDLKAKYYRDMRSADAVQQSILKLTKMANPWHYRRIGQAAELKEKVRTQVLTVEELWDILHGDYLGGLSHGVELAVVSKLEKIKGWDAVIVLAQRALSYSRIGVLVRTFNALSRCVDDGGLLPLAASMTFDGRVWADKLKAIGRGVGASVFQDFAHAVPGVRRHLKSEVLPLLLAFEASGVDDLKYGSVLCRHYDRTVDPAGESLPLPDDNLRAEAEQYAQERLPGLLKLIRSATFGQF